MGDMRFIWIRNCLECPWHERGEHWVVCWYDPEDPIRGQEDGIPEGCPMRIPNV